MKNTIVFIYLLISSILANSQTVDFNYQTSDGLFCNPSSVQFTQTSTGSPAGFAWTFGNGEFSNSPNPQIVYNNPGTYTVKLIVIYMQNTVSVTKTIVINPSVTTSIGYDRNYICTPGVINFAATSSGNITAYDWDFGDGSGIQTTTANTITHGYTGLGVYNVKLKATDVSGCSDNNTTVIKVQDPGITGTVSPRSGCVPANVNFKANAVIPANSAVTNYAWDFGDGSVITNTAANTTNHVYNAAGNYSPGVTITTSEGCSSTYKFSGIAFGTPPFNHIAYPVKAVICGSDAAVLVSKATDANSYYWNFGDGITATVSDTITRHKYATLGTKNITVTPSYNGCNGISQTFQIDVVGVIASYVYSNSCIDKKTFSFTNTSQGNLSSIVWNFGDGSPVVNTPNAVHTFPSSGSFVTTLTVTDSVTGCTDTYTRTIYTSDPSLVNNDSSICRNTTTRFSTVNNYANPAATYTWHIVGKQTSALTDSSLSIKADIFGDFNNYVIINGGAQYCSDTIFLDHKILVRGPALAFTAPASVCFNDSFNVVNASKPYLPEDSVSLWYWNFGTGVVNDSTYQPEPYMYSRAGRYNVKLFGIDKNGCYDSLVKPVTVNPLPFLLVVPGLDTLCAGEADTLFAFHNENITWSPAGSLSCATCDTVVANPSVTTDYLVTATSRFGCISRDSAFVKVFPRFVATPLASDIFLCLNDSVQLNVDPAMKEIVWSPSVGLSNSNNYGPIAFPRETTTYTATLTDSVGCFTSSTDITVHVKSLPTVDAGPDQTYPYNFSYSLNPLYSNNIASYTWTPSNLLSCRTCPNPNGIASSSASYLIEVISDSGCVAKDSINIFIECKDANLLVPNAFTPNNDNLNDYFYPLARGIKSIARFSIYDRFGRLVFERRNFLPNDKAFGWNGRIHNMDQTTSVFVYYVEALCDKGEKLYKKGTVTLIR